MDTRGNENCVVFFMFGWSNRDTRINHFGVALVHASRCWPWREQHLFIREFTDSAPLSTKGCAAIYFPRNSFFFKFKSFSLLTVHWIASKGKEGTCEWYENDANSFLCLCAQWVMKRAIFPSHMYRMFSWDYLKCRWNGLVIAWVVHFVPETALRNKLFCRFNYSSKILACKRKFRSRSRWGGASFTDCRFRWNWMSNDI